MMVDGESGSTLIHLADLALRNVCVKKQKALFYDKTIVKVDRRINFTRTSCKKKKPQQETVPFKKHTPKQVRPSVRRIKYANSTSEFSASRVTRGRDLRNRTRSSVWYLIQTCRRHTHTHARTRTHVILARNSHLRYPSIYSRT